jgi:hypothetical protein
MFTTWATSQNWKINTGTGGWQGLHIV